MRPSGVPLHGSSQLHARPGAHACADTAQKRGDGAALDAVAALQHAHQPPLAARVRHLRARMYTRAALDAMLIPAWQAHPADVVAAQDAFPLLPPRSTCILPLEASLLVHALRLPPWPWHAKTIQTHIQTRENTSPGLHAAAAPPVPRAALPPGGARACTICAVSHS